MDADSVKAFLNVEIDAEKPGFPVTVNPLPVAALRPVSRKAGAFDSFYSAPSREPWADHYLEISLTDGEIVANPMNLLKPRYPWLLSVRQAALEKNALPDPEGDALAGDQAAQTGARRNAVDDFRAFEESLYGTADPDREALFAALLKECRSEA